MEIKKVLTPQVSVVITCYNNGDIVSKNIPKVIEAFNYRKNCIIEVIVVDDASKDKSASIIESKFPKVKLVRHKINRGFSAATNTGVRTAKGNIIALLNSDVAPKKDFLVSVVKRFRNPKLFGVSFNEGAYSWTRALLRDGYIDYEPGDRSDRAVETFWVSGGSCAVRRDYYISLGGMDEKLFSPFYWEDIDLSYRAQKRGLTNIWDPDALVDHSHETTIKKLPKKYVSNIQERNQLLFHWKNLTSPSLTKKHIVGVINRLSRHPGYLKIIIMALLKLKHVIRARSKEVKDSSVSDEAVLARFSK